MKWFHFGEKLIYIIRMLFTDIKLATLNNGYMSPFITPHKGLFQGNPLASYLFIIVIELLAIRLCQNLHIKGIKIGLQEVLLSLFADDLALTTQFCQKSWEATVKEFENFQTQTGMQINYNKLTVYRMGSIRKTNTRFYSKNKLQWTDDPICILGISIASNYETLIKMNFEPLIQKSEAILAMWSQRNLMLAGKILILNSLISSLYMYRLSLLPTPPDTLFLKICKMCKEFI